MRIGILGPLEVRDADGRSLPVGGARLRSLLIRLAIAGGDAVPVDRLAADLWPDEGPAGAANAVQALVSRLRGAAGKDIVSLGPTGYRLTVPSGEIDAWAFERPSPPRTPGSPTATTRRPPRRSGPRCGCGAGPRSPTSPTPRSRRGPSPGCPSCGSRRPRTGSMRTWRSARAPSWFRRSRSWRGSTRCGSGCAASSCARCTRPAGRRTRWRVFEDTRELLSAQLGVDPSPALSDVHLAILRAELAREPRAGLGARSAPRQPARSADELCGPGRGPGTGREPPPGRVAAGHAHRTGRGREDEARGRSRWQGGGPDAGRRLVRAAGAGPGCGRRAAGGADRRRARWLVG